MIFHRHHLREGLKNEYFTTLIEAYGIAQKIEATLIYDRGTTSGYKGKDTDRKMEKVDGKDRVHRAVDAMAV
ncbi:hypothetical protein PanWU01x14_366430, partial [Parasponia andersonii]